MDGTCFLLMYVRYFYVILSATLPFIRHRKSLSHVEILTIFCISFGNVIESSCVDFKCTLLFELCVIKENISILIL